MRMNHHQAAQFIIKIGVTEGKGVKLLDFEHALLDSGNESYEGLLRMLTDAEKLIIGDKMSYRLLLDKKNNERQIC